ncbi:hypothetical protein PWG71_16515 [Nocardiopsis sp. N85]|uniref:hypothetical protein n=1 Tax=Nocardiopsis sp. N85 TaxID=3029400 RepID=UPI00237F1BCA|nr:hypothetical protein [Nocardiopsis sp. N85]MDE3722994.1 hypothetical protein [Nocardiopsis sp. N85]
MNLIRNIPAVTAASALLPCLLFGSAGFLTRLGAWSAWPMLPSALGAPFAVPALSVVPIGEQPWSALTVELVAVAVLVAVVWWWTARSVRRRPDASAGRAFFAGWAAFALGAMASGAPRALVPAWEMGLGPIGWYAMLAGGLLTGLLWGSTLGWVCGVARVAVRGRVAATA